MRFPFGNNEDKPCLTPTTNLESRIQYDNDHPNHGNLPDRECNSIRKNLVWALALLTISRIGADGAWPSFL
jgi:hypothetical protein